VDVADEDDTNKNEAIEPDKKPEEIRQTPFALPAGYEWTEIDVLVEGEVNPCCPFFYFILIYLIGRCTAQGALRASLVQLCRRRRQHVPL